MKRWGLFSVVSQVLMALLLGLALVAPAAAAADPAKVPRASPDSPRRIAKYWTPARMRDAVPLETRLGAAAAPAAPGRAEALASSRAVADPTALPFATAGRIFARDGRGIGYWCSGFAVDTPTRTVVMTAAHCLELREPPRYRTNWARYLMFVPAYGSHQAPFGAFVSEELIVHRHWFQHQNPNYDVGVVVTVPNNRGEAVADAVGGGAAVALNISRQQIFDIAGYPGLDQQRMRACVGYFTGKNRFTYAWGGKPQSMVDCRLAPGSSGGPWFISEPGEPAVVNGLTSLGGLTSNREAFLSSPYFTWGNVGRLLDEL